MRLTLLWLALTATVTAQAAEVTGVGIAILNHGNVAYLKAYGFRDTEKKLPLTPDSVMSAASFTKVAFGYLVMKLVDQGVLDLDKPVQEYLPKPLPEYPNYADLAGDPRYKKITARMLLSHTAGFPNWRWFEDDHKLKIHFEPGSRFAYSGEGIDLPQLVVETITKAPLEELMQQHMFQPLQMTRTSMVWQFRQRLRRVRPLARPAEEKNGRRRRLDADHSARLHQLLAGGGRGQRPEQEILRTDVQPANPDQSQVRVPELTDGNHRRQQSHPPQLRACLGALLDALRQSLFQGRA